MSQSRKHIITVDDDPAICKLVGHYLLKEGFKVSTAGSGKELFDYLADGHHADLIILDLMLPDMDGLEITRKLRASSHVPIIMLTGRAEPVEKIAGLEVGADDYVTKPFNERELLARVRSVLRRCAPAAIVERDVEEISEQAACFAGWRLDIKERVLTSPEEESVHLTNQEFQLLRLLIKQPNHVVSRDQILDVIAKRDWTPFDRSADVLVGKLRKKLGENSAQATLIQTVRGAGYKLVGRVERC